jgi:hypothetical protein
MQFCTSAIQAPEIEAALSDLRRDLNKVRPENADPFAKWCLELHLDKTLIAETFVLRITDCQKIEIHAGDALGAVYGIYEFSQRFLGVDPLWFWKEIEPLKIETFTPPPQRIDSGKPAFCYRGWFINDEDLLADWKEPAGKRFINWPKRDEVLAQPPSEQADNYEYRLLQYYSPIVATTTMEMVYEAALRLRANLIIPASFVDVMNPPEAAMIGAAIRRGFYVSQHHVEPIGVSHFAYETWWGAQNKSPEFSYRSDAESMRACWRAYAERWHRIAGDKLIWQVGLRGRGDRPLWTHDPAAQARAGEFISAALADQMAIIQSVDPRPQVPATLTLWHEGAKLIRDKKLEAPAGVSYIFTDNAQTQEMQSDFETLPRHAHRHYGNYYHIAVWSMGPHLVSGPNPEKIIRIIQSQVNKGDTHYAILNVANLREHTLGMSVWTQQVWQPKSQSNQEILSTWSTAELAPLHQSFLDSIPQLQAKWYFYDGSARLWIDRLISNQIDERQSLDGFLKEVVETKRDEVIQILQHAVDRFDQLMQQVKDQEACLPARLQAFCHFQLQVQVHILAELYRVLITLLQEKPDYSKAITALDAIQHSFQEGEHGQWKNWYRGDKKVGVASIRQRILALQKSHSIQL